ncbi:MAG: glycerol-3-phosphate dehydrogenase/oxidase [Gammaproteobacteria bacterium]
MDRAANLARLAHEDFDVLVIGGGATGAGVALDAASRGLRTALVERGDFACGTSSRSTKLVHGGVRYLEAAVAHLDRAQFHLVREALAERAALLAIAPHLVHPLRTVVPAYSLREALFYRIGLWLYDRAAGEAAIGRSHFVSRAAMLRSFPRLRTHGLRGGVAYYDGQFNDARMNVTVIATAAREGAVVANYAEATALVEERGRIAGARLRDQTNDNEFSIRARAVVNATGPFSDALRRLEEPNVKPLLATSRGTHLALDRTWAPGEDGLLIPKTSDGRVLFLLPWEGGTIAGTTDIRSEPTSDPEPSAEELTYLFGQLAEWLEPAPTPSDLRAAWAGLRPLIAEGATGTARIVREHHIEVGPKGLVSIAGGKWTTYRLMAEETVDRVIETAGFTPRNACRTRKLLLVGADGYHAELATELAVRYALDDAAAVHLARAYGSTASELIAAGGETGRQRLVTGYPYIQAEVLWAVRQEMALTAEDVLARRLRLAFLDRGAAEVARPRVEVLLRPTV